MGDSSVWWAQQAATEVLQYQRWSEPALNASLCTMGLKWARTESAPAVKFNYDPEEDEEVPVVALVAGILGGLAACAGGVFVFLWHKRRHRVFPF